MIQQVQQPCDVCKGTGKIFSNKKEREVLEVFVEKGAPDGHKVVFSGKADEHPDADPGDVIFILKVKEHEDFIRRGADLFIKRDISLQEALCGYTLEVNHLDGRKLMIKSNPGEVCSPLKTDPLAAAGSADFESFNDSDCTCNNTAQAETEDVDACKKVCEKKGFTAFVIQDGNAFFKSGSREEVMSTKTGKTGSTLYVLQDPNAVKDERLCKAVKGEGMPTHKNPFVCGNLFLLLNIAFPSELDATAVAALKKCLPPALQQQNWKEDDVEVHYLTDMDPVSSYKEGVASSGKDAYDDDEEQGGGGPGGQRVQCNQQ